MGNCVLLCDLEYAATPCLLTPINNLAVEMNEDLHQIDPQLQEAISAAVDHGRGAVVNEDVGHVAVRDNLMDYFGCRLLIRTV